MEKAGAKRERAFNEAIWLYDMNADDMFEHDGYLMVDTSLGLLREHGEVTESKSPEATH